MKKNDHSKSKLKIIENFFLKMYEGFENELVMVLLYC